MDETHTPSNDLDRSQDKLVLLWNNGETPVCPTVKRTVTPKKRFGDTSGSYAWCPGLNELSA